MQMNYAYKYGSLISLVMWVGQSQLSQVEEFLLPANWTSKGNKLKKLTTPLFLQLACDKINKYLF